MAKSKGTVKPKRAVKSKATAKPKRAVKSTRAVKSKAVASKSAGPSKELVKYLRAWNGYPITEIRPARCPCGKAVFAVIDAGDAGGAKRICVACEREHLICDSAEHWDEADPGECACPCGNESFEVAAGFAFYDGSTDVRWIYVGLRCTDCKKSGVYADWKIDYAPAHQLLDQV